MGMNKVLWLIILLKIGLSESNAASNISSVRFERSDECSNTKKNLDTAKAAMEAVDKAKDFKVVVEGTLKKLADTASSMTGIFPATAVAGALLGFFSTQQDANCKLMAKLNEIYDAIKAVSRQINSLEFIIKCEGVQQNWRDIGLKIAKLTDVMQERDISLARSTCNDPAGGIRDILASFMFFVREDDVLKLFQSCAKYESENIKIWSEKIVQLSQSIITLIGVCDVANDRGTKFDFIKFSNEVKAVLQHAAFHLVKQHFFKDSSNLGLNGAVMELTESIDSADKLCTKLNEKYAYYDWDAVFVSDQASFKVRESTYCGSKFYKKAVVAWSDKSLMKQPQRALYPGYKPGKDMEYIANQAKEYYGDNYIFIYATRNYRSINSNHKFSWYSDPKIVLQFLIFLGNGMCWSSVPNMPDITTQSLGVNKVGDDIAALGSIGNNVDYIRIQADNIANATGEINIKVDKISDDTGRISVVADKIADDTGYVRLQSDAIKDDTGYIRLKVKTIDGNINYTMVKVDEIKDDTGYIRVKADQIADDTGHIRLKADKIADDTGHIRIKADQIADDTGYIRIRSDQVLENTNKILIGQDGIRQDIQYVGRELGTKLDQGFSEVYRGQQEIKENIQSVGNDVRSYGKRGIAERAAILDNVRNYGEISIKQQNKILKNLDVINDNVGIVQKTQLEEAQKSSVRFDYMKYSLDSIQSIQMDESVKNENRFHVVSGGINDLKTMHVVEANKNAERFQVVNSGIGDIKNQLAAESELSSKRFGVLNNGVERIQTHLIIESQLNEKRYVSLQSGVNDIRATQVEESILASKRFQASTEQAAIHFGILSNGISDISQTMDRFHDQTMMSQEEILNFQKREAVIGTQRYNVISSSMYAVVDMLEQQGLKNDEILSILNTEKENNLQRFQWITGAFRDQRQMLSGIADKQNLTVFLLNELSRSIEIKSQVISSSFSDVLNGIRSFSMQYSSGTGTIIDILYDIRKIIGEKPTILEIEQSLELNEYVKRQTELESLAISLKTYLEINDTFSYDSFQENCKIVNSDRFLDYLINKLQPVSSSSLGRTNILSTFITLSENSVGKFKELASVLIKDADKAEYLSKVCIKFGKIPIDAKQFDFYIKKSVPKLEEILRILLTSGFSLPSDLSKILNSKISNQIMSKTSKNIQNNELAAFLFNQMVLNYNWNSWAVIVNDVPFSATRQLSLQSLNIKEAQLFPKGGSLIINNVVLDANNTKTVTVMWKPAILDSNVQYLKPETWNCIYQTLKATALRTNKKLNELEIADMATDVSKQVLSRSQIGFCSVFAILHQSYSNGTIEHRNLNMNAKVSMKSIDSRVFVLDLYKNSNFTLEMFIDVNPCDQSAVVNTNIKSSFDGYNFLVQMPLTELALNEPQIAITNIYKLLANYFKSLWSVTVVARADETNTLIDIKYEKKYIHLRWFGYNIILAEGVSSIDSSMSIPGFVTFMPSVMSLNGRGPCVIDEISTNLKNNYVKLNMANTTFYTQCAGPIFISIQLPNRDAQKGFECESQPIDCKLGDWDAWSGCSNRSLNSEVRTREILVSPNDGGKLCDQTNETRPCIHIDCTVSEWSKWTECNGEFMVRTRTIVSNMLNGGRECPKLEEKQSCRNCEVTKWSDWSKCDGKFTTRTRGVVINAENGGKECPTLQEKQACSDCQMSEWSPWSECSNGFRTRSRTVIRDAEMGGKPCDSLIDKQECVVIDCKVGQWSKWTKCDGSFVTKTRQILIKAENGGKECPALQEKQACSDCKLSEWSQWTACTNGFRTRSRTILANPKMGGKPCDSLTDKQECVIINCKVSEWTAWSGCIDKTVDEEKRTRTVLINPENGGTECEPLEEKRKCDDRVFQVVKNVQLKNDYNHVPSELIKSHGDCWAKCKEDNQCKAATLLFHGNQRCYYFNKDFTEKDEDNWISVISDENNVHYGKRLYGHMDATENVATLSQCFENCKSYKGCVAVTYGYPSEDLNCYLFKDNIEFVKTADNWVSYVDISVLNFDNNWSDLPYAVVNELRLFNHYREISGEQLQSKSDCWKECAKSEECKAATINYELRKDRSCFLFGEGFQKSFELNWVSLINGRYYNDMRLFNDKQVIQNIGSPAECYFDCSVQNDCIGITQYEPPTNMRCYLFNDNYRFEKQHYNSVSFVKSKSIKDTSMCFQDHPWKQKRAVEDKIEFKDDNLVSETRVKSIEKRALSKNTNATLVMAVVEHSSLPQKYTANKLASAMCVQLAQNFNQTIIASLLDQDLTRANGWSVIVFNKGLSTQSTLSLNIIENLFIYSVCTTSQLNGGDRKEFKTFSFIAFYLPENNCYQNEREDMISDTKSDTTRKYQNIVDLVNNDEFRSEYLVFNDYKIHRSTNIISPTLLEYLITRMLQVFNSSPAKVFISEEIRKSIGTFWNVIVNPDQLVTQISTPLRANTLLRIQIKGYDIVMFHTPYYDCF